MGTDDGFRLVGVADEATVVARAVAAPIDPLGTWMFGDGPEAASFREQYIERQVRALLPSGLGAWSELDGVVFAIPRAATPDPPPPTPRTALRGIRGTRAARAGAIPTAWRDAWSAALPADWPAPLRERILQHQMALTGLLPSGRCAVAAVRSSLEDASWIDLLAPLVAPDPLVIVAAAPAAIARARDDLLPLPRRSPAPPEVPELEAWIAPARPPAR
ncbi:MAG: hypothetical protein U0P45_02590 [Acidimicrobiales bacterium]